LKKTLVTVLSLVCFLGNIGAKSAHAQSLRINQEDTMKHNMVLSKHKINWYHGPGHWTLHERFKTCKAVAHRYSERRAGICYVARVTLERHAKRYEKIVAILFPKPKLVYGNGGYNWSSMVYNCEAKGVSDPWYANTGNGFFFGPQFTPTTWHNSGGGAVREMDGHGPSMHSYPIDYIEHIAYNVMKSQGPGAWPNCNSFL
jgi:hypothetical protein